jgi:hypothetical protein
LGATKHRAIAALDVRTFECRYDAPIALEGKGVDSVARRPIVTTVALGVVERTGVDSALEETLHTLVDLRFTKGTIAERIEAERRNVAFIENERVAQGKRPVVVGIVVQQAEELRRSTAVGAVALDEQLTVYRMYH